MTKKEIILKVDENIRNDFKARCSVKGLSMTFVLTQFMKEYVKRDIIETRPAAPKVVYLDDEGFALPEGNFPKGYLGGVVPSDF